MGGDGFAGYDDQPGRGPGHRDLDDGGLICEGVAQTTTELNSPSLELERLLGVNRLRHGGNPVLRWMADNVTLYTDSSCNKNPYPVPADGSCNPVYQQGASYNSYVYSGGAAQNVSCNASGTSTATVVLEGEVTVCCAPCERAGPLSAAARTAAPARSVI